jgi:hypothetical protein
METPRFPRASAALYARTDPAGAARFVGDADAWARAVGLWLEGPAPVSDKLKALLEQLLRGGAPKGADFRPYGLVPFPRGGSPVERAVSVVRWRAAVVSFLSDIWDVIGEPLFELDDCQLALEVFMPVGPKGSYCTSCLLDVAEAGRLEHAGRCPARVPPPERSPHAP